MHQFFLANKGMALMCNNVPTPGAHWLCFSVLPQFTCYNTTLHPFVFWSIVPVRKAVK